MRVAFFAGYAASAPGVLRLEGIQMLEPKARRCPVCKKSLPLDSVNRRFCSQKCAKASPEFGRKRRDPTPREIDQRAAEIRRTWTPDERAKRRTVPVEPWTPPVVAEADLTATRKPLLDE